MDRRNRGNVLSYALQCAKLDRQAMAECWESGSSGEKEALADIEMFRRLQIELFGTCGNQLDEHIDKCVAIPAHKIRDYISGKWSPD